MSMAKLQGEQLLWGRTPIIVDVVLVLFRLVCARPPLNNLCQAELQVTPLAVHCGVDRKWQNNLCQPCCQQPVCIMAQRACLERVCRQAPGPTPP